MNSHYHRSEQPLFRIAFFPKPLTHNALHRHPIFRWHKHMRYVREEPVISENDIYGVKYTDTRTNTVFMDRESAEKYLDRVIPKPSYDGELYVEKQRDIFVDIICGHCGHVAYEKKEVVFLGPFNTVLHEITTKTNIKCPSCNKSICVDVSTEKNINMEPDQDCEWLVRPLSNDVRTKNK